MAEAEERAPLLPPDASGKPDVPGEAKDTKKDHVEQEDRATILAKGPKVAYTSLFRFSTPVERAMIYLACFLAAIHGVLMPLNSVILGNIINELGDPSSDVVDVIAGMALLFVYLGIGSLVLSYVQTALLMRSSQRQTARIRRRYLRACLGQDHGWHDARETGELTTRLASDVPILEEAISAKLGQFVQYTSMFFAGFGIGFYRGWQMSLVILSVVPILMVCMGFLGKVLTEHTTRGQLAYSLAGAAAEEVISCVRTVVAFGGEAAEEARYAKELEYVEQAGVRKGTVIGLGLGVTFLVMFSSYGLAFWYGSTLISSGVMDPGSIVNVFFAIIMGAMAISQMAPLFNSFAAGRGAAVSVFELIERVPTIDVLSDAGESLTAVTGRVSFQRVYFSYPTRPDVPVLRGISLDMEPGQTVALVGHSGCGKSTLVALLQRFYDPVSGRVLVDGRDIRNLNVASLRSFIGVVSQEPVLFNTTIAQNIRHNRTNVSHDDIVKAAEAANAHDFISALPEGYNTVVGQRGTQLSGGQKQRIAIARALIRDPRILILDEATSALDAESEAVVQEALDRARQGRTTLVVAHRLSTVRHADRIVVINNGDVAETGTHDELMSAKGLYSSLVGLQQRSSSAAVDTENSARGTSSRRASKAISRKSVAVRALDDPDIDTASDVTTTIKYTDKSSYTPMWRAFKLNRPELSSIILGIFASIICGVVWPVFAIILSQVMSVLFNPDADEREAEVRLWSLMFVAIAATVGLFSYLQAVAFSISNERLTTRLRRLMFRALLRQEIGWFDRSENATGALATRLSTDPTSIAGCTGPAVGRIVQIIATAVGGLVIAFTACPELALVILACTPAIALGSFLQFKTITGADKVNVKAYEESGKVASEAMENIRTVTSLGDEPAVLLRYDAILSSPESRDRRTAHINGLGVGYSEFTVFCIWAISYWYGARTLEAGTCTFDTMMRAITAITLGGQMLGQTASLMPDASKGFIAAAELFALIDRVPMIDAASEEGKRPESMKGDVALESVQFSYATRRKVPVLKGLSLSIKSGQTVALVGASGCGKSTIAALLERFYDPEGGNVTVDGHSVAELNLEWLRSKISIVAQEPVLFSTTIGDNIAYGRPSASPADIESAARLANAHNFISALPNGYATQVGERGAQLSGGQKQRIAIARALIRDPSILILDEATSALDSESEAVVQEALDAAARGRTAIVIAHRLSTIVNADSIAVIEGGVVREQGTYEELMEKRGVFYALVRAQTH